MANPFPSAIQIPDGGLGPDFDNAIYLYDGSNFLSLPLNLGSPSLAKGQAFMIRKSTVGGTSDFVFPNNWRTDGSPVLFNSLLPDNFINITLFDGQSSKEVLIYFDSLGTNYFDPEKDAVRLFSHPNQSELFINDQDNERLSHDARNNNLLLSGGEINFGLYSGNVNSFNLSINPSPTFGNAMLYFQDSEQGGMQAIGNGLNYSFSELSQTFNNRFKIIILPSVTGTQFVNKPNKLKAQLHQNSIEFQIPEEMIGCEIGLIDITGKKLAVWKLETSNQIVSIESLALAKGMYLLHSTFHLPSLTKIIIP